MYMRHGSVMHEIGMSGAVLSDGWTAAGNLLLRNTDQELLASLGSPEYTRPLLLSALGLEVASLQEQAMAGSGQCIPAEELLDQSRVASILRIPYGATHLPDLIEKMDGLETIDTEKLFDYFCGNHAGEEPRPINSSLRNALLVPELNRTVLANSPYQARLDIVPYTWRDRYSSLYSQSVPALPGGYEDETLHKFIVTLVKDDDPMSRATFSDYGDTAGDNINVTGEDLALTSLAAAKLINPEDPGQLRQGLSFIADSQYKPSHKGAVELLRLSKDLTSYVEAEAAIEPFPLHLAGVEDLTETQIGVLAHIGNSAMRMWELYQAATGNRSLAFQRLVHWEDAANVLVQTKQPSTRTVLAAMSGALAAGFNPIKLDQSESSQAKNESPASEALTLTTQNIAAVLSRDPDFERTTEVLKQTRADQAGADPVRISLGGNHHHPTQTLAELFVIMENYGCSTLEELRAKTADDPPSIVFIGHTANKRADLSLIEFVAEHLPAWSTTVLVPDERYLPKDLDLPEAARYRTVVDHNLTDQAHVAELTEGADFLYISNAEGTAGDDGKGDAFRPPDYYLSAEVVAANGLKVLAPLPASGELDAVILNNGRFNQNIVRTVQYKNAVITGALLMMLASRQQRTSVA